MNFSSLAEFLDTAADCDCEFLGGEISKTAPTACAMANSCGGLIILGAEREYDDKIEITGFNQSELDLNSLIPDGISFDVKNFENVLIIKINPLPAHEKPLFYDGKFYRRVENSNLISSRHSAVLMAGSVLGVPKDDEPAMNLYLDPESLNDFYETVIKIHDEYKNFSHEDFLCKSFIFSGKFLTFAGALMFGNIIRVRVILNSDDKHIEIEAQNIWDAYKNILPRLANKLSPGCSQAFQEIFVNALLHSDYEIGNFIEIFINSDPAKVLITNPGIITGHARNRRLKKIFGLSGMSAVGRGLETVKKFMPTFRLEQDMLNFRVKAKLLLSGMN